MKPSTNSPIVNRRVPIAIVIGLTLFSGIVHGYLDGRWSAAEDLREQGARLDAVPSQCGDWELVETTKLNEDAAQLLRCYGETNRVYRHRDTQQVIRVAVLFGPRGPIAVHTPEICYDSVGTKQSGERQVETVSTAQYRHQFWSVRFAPTGEAEPNLEVWYAWSRGGGFQAADYPRFWMTESLYKIQLAGPVSQGQNQPISEFLEEFLPQVEDAVH